MGGYIRVDKDLPDDPRVWAIAEAYLDYWQAQTGFTDKQLASLRQHAHCTALGAVVTLWCYIDTHLDHADIIRCVTHTLSDVTQIPLEVLKKWPLEWLQDNGDGTIRAPHYSIKNALLDKEERREKTRLRVERLRQKRRKSKHGQPVTNTALPKRYTSVTTGPGPGPIRDRDRDPVDKSASEAAPAAARAPRDAPPRQNPEPQRQPRPEPPRDTPAPGFNSWVPNSAPPAPRTTTFDQEFKARFGVSPDEAHRMREAAATQKPKPDKPKD